MTAKREERLRILTQTDAPLWERGVAFAGMDEAGRGPLAGNVVAACVVMPPMPLLPWVDDSKRLSPARREKVFDEIMQTALFVGVGQATAAEIDEINILNATKNAMRRAAQGAPATRFSVSAVSPCGVSSARTAKPTSRRPSSPSAQTSSWSAQATRPPSSSPTARRTVTRASPDAPPVRTTATVPVPAYSITRSTPDAKWMRPGVQSW